MRIIKTDNLKLQDDLDGMFVQVCSDFQLDVAKTKSDLGIESDVDVNDLVGLCSVVEIRISIDYLSSRLFIEYKEPDHVLESSVVETPETDGGGGGTELPFD